MAADKFELKQPEFEGMRYDGTNAAAIKAWADTFDDFATAVVDGQLRHRPGGNGLFPVAVGNWIVASRDVNPPVFMQEPADMSKKFKTKP